MKKVACKWGKQKMDVEIEDDDFDTFQAQLFALTGVPVERQKIMCKGKMLKASGDLAKLKDGAKIVLMGTADAVASGPKEKVLFVEDMTTEQKTEMTGAAGGGLVNLGNTCYMNSTLQCLRAVKPLKDALLRSINQSGPSGDMRLLLTQSMGRLFKAQDASSGPVSPQIFWHALRGAFPQFDQRSPQGGHYMQQDAEECLSSILGAVSDTQSSTVDATFGGQMVVTENCDESPEEPPTVSQESFTRLKCFIDGNTNFLFQGIEKGLTDQVEKRSQTLNRNALYSRKRKISSLPKYMIINFVRFNWRNDTKNKAKILRRVQFTHDLDVVEFCASDLRKSIQQARENILEAENKKLGLKSMKAKKSNSSKDKDKEKSEAVKMEDVEDATAVEPNPLTSGHYSLFGVVTHKGREADSGHYVGWTRQALKEGQVLEGEAANDHPWYKFDDDVVTTVTGKDIVALSGGGDWHMSYLAMYERVDDMPAKNAQIAAEAAERKAKPAK